MELKLYEKPWLPAFKGAFLIIFGLLAMIQIIGSIKALAMLFVALISAMAILLIATTIFNKNTKYKVWNIVMGAINLIFGLFLIIKVESPSIVITRIILIWVVFYVLTEFIEAGILISEKNAFAALFVQDGLLSVLFGYFLYIAIGKFTPEAVFYIGIIALIIGITNVLSSYLLSTLKK
jgi:uncharacterized membrane protein HdeD (DUF308 family)